MATQSKANAVTESVETAVRARRRAQREGGRQR